MVGPNISLTFQSVFGSQDGWAWCRQLRSRNNEPRAGGKIQPHKWINAAEGEAYIGLWEMAQKNIDQLGIK